MEYCEINNQDELEQQRFKYITSTIELILKLSNMNIEQQEQVKGLVSALGEVELNHGISIGVILLHCWKYISDEEVEQIKEKLKLDTNGKSIEYIKDYYRV